MAEENVDLGFKIYTTEIDEEFAGIKRPSSIQYHKHSNAIINGRAAMVDIYVIGNDYQGRLKLPDGVRCLEVINYVAGGQDIVVRAEHHEFHKTSPEMLSDKITREKGKELDIGALLGMK